MLRAPAPCSARCGGEVLTEDNGGKTTQFAVDERHKLRGIFVAVLPLHQKFQSPVSMRLETARAPLGTPHWTGQYSHLAGKSI